jgi:hypothetical protein
MVPVMAHSFLVQLFLQKLRNDNTLNDDELEDVFCNLGDVVSLHERFVECLLNRMSNWDDQKTTIGDLFLDQVCTVLHDNSPKKSFQLTLFSSMQFVQFIAVYRPYIHSYNTSLSLVYFLRRKNEKFAEAIQVGSLNVVNTGTLF